MLSYCSAVEESGPLRRALFSNDVLYGRHRVRLTQGQVGLGYPALGRMMSCTRKCTYLFFKRSRSQPQQDHRRIFPTLPDRQKAGRYAREQSVGRPSLHLLDMRRAH